MKPLELGVGPKNMRRYQGPVDACIIGCGAGGSVLAKELSEAGWRVVVLEAGSWLSTDRDFRQDEVEMLGKFDWDDRRWLAGEEELELGHRRDGRGVGGGTLHFGGVALRMWPEDFERKTRDGVGEDWPISYRELELYYDLVEKEMALSGPETMPWGPKRYAYPQPPHQMTARDMLVAQGMSKLGIRWVPTPLAILTGEHEGRSPCMNYGYCQWGCKSRAKTSVHLNYVPKAVLAGAEIRTEARAVQIQAERSGKIRGVVYVQDGKAKRQEADVYVLSAFCIENPRLLLHSANAQFPDGLANSSGSVGRYLLAHIADSHFGRFEEPVHMWSTAPGTLLSQEYYGTKEGNSFTGGWSWMTGNLYPGEFATTLVKSSEGYWGDKLIKYLEQYPNFVLLGTEGECLPYEDNRVELSGEKDEFGVPRPKVTFNYGTNERNMRDEIHRLTRHILEAAGADEVLISEGNDHTMGGCRMGNDLASSVVDRHLKTHDHPNLYICDASVFVTPGGAQPSQTIMALATRLAEHLTGKPAARRAREKQRLAV
ncbi:MAG: GMC family oxidoreductase [Actinomycetota bacterium]|nr:GMC family oxidoreductase [Actinomycetota bacterium]